MKSWGNFVDIEGVIMRFYWKLFLSLGFFWSSAWGMTQDFTPFFGKLTQAEYQTRLEGWMVADGKNCDPAGRVKALAYLKRHFVERAEGLQVYADTESSSLLTSIPWKTIDTAEAEESAPYTLILDPGKERDMVTFTGSRTGTFNYKEAMASAARLVQEKFHTTHHPRLAKVLSTSDAFPMPTTSIEGVTAAQRLIQGAHGPVLLVTVHMNVSRVPEAGIVPISSEFPYIVSFVPGGYMEEELKAEPRRIYSFLQHLFSEQIPTSIALAQRINEEIQKAFRTTALLDAATARQIKAFDLHTCSLTDTPGVQGRNLAITALPAACVYTFGPCYNHPDVVEACLEASRDLDTGVLPISRILADAIYNGIIGFLDGPAAPAHATVPE